MTHFFKILDTFFQHTLAWNPVINTAIEIRDGQLQSTKYKHEMANYSRTQYKLSVRIGRYFVTSRSFSRNEVENVSAFFSTIWIHSIISISAKFFFKSHTPLLPSNVCCRLKGHYEKLISFYLSEKQVYYETENLYESISGW